MANICSFTMHVEGEHSNIENFYNALCQEGDIYMGRGADAEIDYYDDDKVAHIIGSCKWSVYAALILDAKSMRNEPDDWCFVEKTENGYELVNGDKYSYITLDEACKKWNVKVEVYSEEPGCCFQEHYMIDNDGEIIINECNDYFEYWVDDYNSKEDAEKAINITISDEEWEEGQYNSYFSRGGFVWDFSF